jgi:hypothetical protein
MVDLATLTVLAALSPAGGSHAEEGLVRLSATAKPWAILQRLDLVNRRLLLVDWDCRGAPAADALNF